MIDGLKNHNSTKYLEAIDIPREKIVYDDDGKTTHHVYKVRDYKAMSGLFCAYLDHENTYYIVEDGYLPYTTPDGCSCGVIRGKGVYKYMPDMKEYKCIGGIEVIPLEIRVWL